MPPIQQPIVNKTHWRFLAAVIIGVLLLVVGMFAYRAYVFHIIKTDPKMSEVGNYSPFMRIYFNDPLKDGSVKVTGTSDVVASVDVKDKVVTVNFNPNLIIGKNYTVTLVSAANKKGDTITDRKFTFKVKDISIDKLSKAQQQDIMSKVDNIPYSVYTVAFNGFDELTNSGGLSSDQEQLVKQAIFDYNQQQAVKLTQVTLDTASIFPEAFDPNSADASRSVHFTVVANDTTYTVRATYSDISTAQVVLFDQTGRPLFDNTADNTDTTDSVAE
jgi:hypothetical protein